MLFQKIFLSVFTLVLLVCASTSASAHRLAINAETSNEDQSFGVVGESSVPSEAAGRWGFAAFFSRSQDRSNSSQRSNTAGFDLDHEWESGWQLGGGFESARSEPSSAKSSNFKLMMGYVFYRESTNEMGEAEKDKFLQIQLRPQTVRYDYPGNGVTADESYFSRGAQLAVSWYFAQDWKLYAAGSKYTTYDRNPGISGGLFRRTASTGSASTVLAIESELALALSWWINDIFDLEVSTNQSRSDQSGELIRETMAKVGAQAEVMDFTLGVGNSKSDSDNIQFTNFEVGWNF